jgi:mono/diheme cytochrome c family protein
MDFPMQSGPHWMLADGLQPQPARLDATALLPGPQAPCQIMAHWAGGSSAQTVGTLILSLLSCWLVAVASEPAWVVAAEVTGQGGTSLREIKATIDQAVVYATAARYSEAAAGLTKAVDLIRSFPFTGRPPAGLRIFLDRCEELRDDLELAGHDVASLQLPGLDELARQAAPDRKAVAAAAAVAAGPSYAGQIAPLLERRCGGCHISGRRGDFQMASYDQLMQSGMVQPGQPRGSRLLEVIESGDMPRGGGRVTDQEFQLLVSWISAGAVNQVAADGVSAAGGPSHEELLPVRQTKARDLWRFALPDEAVTEFIVGDLILFSTLAEAELKQLAPVVTRAAQQALPAGAEGRPLVTGGVAVYLFPRSTDLSEFWLAALGQQRPRGTGACHGVSGDVAFVAAEIPRWEAGDRQRRGSESRLEGLMVEQMRSLARRSRSGVVKPGR